MTFPIIDCHQHFWRLGQGNYPWLERTNLTDHRYGPVAALQRDYLPADYRADTKDFQIFGTVHVEAEWHPSDPLGETRWLHDLAEAEGLPSAIVGQAWFSRDDIADVLVGQAAFPLTRGVREKPAVTPSADAYQTGLPGSMSDPVWRSGFSLLARHGLHFELQTRYWHLTEAAVLARDFPDIRIILNHSGVPEDRSEAGLAAWRAGMQELAYQTNVSLKISGIGEGGHPWSITRQENIVRECINIFGVDRCMFASNYPVDRLVGEFNTIFKGFLEATEHFSISDRRKLFYGNARKTYGIQ